MMQHVFLSRRNLLTLLSKLDRQAAGEWTRCTIIKNDNAHPKYPQTMVSIAVTAVEDDEYYQHRNPGMMLPQDNPDPSRPESVDPLMDTRPGMEAMIKKLDNLK